MSPQERHNPRRTRPRPRSVVLTIVIVSVLTGITTGIVLERGSLGFLFGFLALLICVSFYALAAAIFRLPKLRWNDVTALWYMLP